MFSNHQHGRHDVTCNRPICCFFVHLYHQVPSLYRVLPLHNATELIPVVQLPPVQVNTVQICVYPWQCLVPQLITVPANDLTQRDSCVAGPTSHDRQKNVANQQNDVGTAESVGDMPVATVEGVNSGSEEKRNEVSRAPTVTGPNTRKRSRSASVSSQDDGKPAPKVQVRNLVS